MLPLPLHSYRVERAVAGARLLNCYAETVPQGAKGAVMLRGAPGIRQVLALGQGPGRGLAVMDGHLFALSGNTLSRITPNGAAVTWGTVPGTDVASFASNGTQLVVSAGGTGYVAKNLAVTPIADGDFITRRPGRVDFLDNYAVWVDEESGRFFSSNLTDFTVYDALDFATAEADPDDLITLAVDHRQILLIGSESSELWYNSGAAGFPFERVSGGVFEIGGAAKNGIAKQDNSVYWLANDRTVRRLEGATPQRVSHHGVERALRDYSTVADCQAYAYTYDGHLCIAFRFPSAGTTWVYDATTREWHERESYLGAAWDVSGFADAYGSIYVQRASTGAVGVLTRDTLTEWGETLVRQWTYQSVYDAGQRLFHSELQLGMDTGVGTLTGQGAVPIIGLEYSNDSGRTWRQASGRGMGEQGRYQTRVRWHRLGSSRDRSYRLTVSDPVPVAVFDTQLAVS